MSTTIPPTRNTSDLWRRAVIRALKGASPVEPAHWPAPHDIAAILTTLAETGATTVCFDNNRFQLVAVDTARFVPGAASALLRLTLNDEVVEVPIAWLDYAPHPKSAADSAFVLSLYTYGEAPARRMVFTHEDGLAISLVSRMGYADDADTLAQVFASGEVQREGSGPEDADERAPTESDPIAAAFHEHRQGVTRPLEQSDVDVIAWAALKAGIQPTLELIRRYAGGGSNTTVHPKLKDFFGRLVKERLNGTEVPPALQRVWAQLQSDADQKAAEDLEPQMKSLLQAEQALAEERTRLQDAQEALASERTALLTADQARETFVASLEQRLTLATEQLAAANHTIAGDADQLAETRTELRLTREQLATAAAALVTREKALATAQQELAAITSQHKALKRETVELADQVVTLTAKLASANDAKLAREEAVRLQQDLDRRAADQLAHRLDTAESTGSEARRELAAAVCRIEQLLSQGGALEAQVSALSRQLAEANTKLEVASVQETRLAAVTGELDAIRSERDHLRSVVSARSNTTHDDDGDAHRQAD